jgi:hypothetical protein
MKKAAPKSSLWFQAGVKKNLVYCMTFYVLGNQPHRPFIVGDQDHSFDPKSAENSHAK